MRPLRGYISIMVSRLGEDVSREGGFATGGWRAPFIRWNSDGSRSESSLGDGLDKASWEVDGSDRWEGRKFK